MTHALLLFVAVVGSVVLTSVDLRAHHSGFEYAQTTVEIEGTLLKVAWTNPHVHFFVRAKDAAGKQTIWDVESNSLTMLRRTEATPEKLKIGDTIKVAGAPSRQAPHKMWASNILTANGREVVLGPGIRPRWVPNAVGAKGVDRPD